MPFTGKATFTAGPDLPELAEDVSDIVSIVSPFETPLLDHLGDPKRVAASTMHEWIEDELFPNFSIVNQTTFTPNASDATAITVVHGDRFRIGDQVRPEGAREIMFVTAVAGNVITVVRRYGGTPTSSLANTLKLHIVGNAALEGDDRPAARFTARARKRNYTQIFTSAVEVSGSMQAARSYGVRDEVDYQKQERLRELLRDLENSVINGTSPQSGQQGSSSVRRTMDGVMRRIATNVFIPGQGGFPQGGGAGNNELTESLLNTALRMIWEQSSGPVDTIVVGGLQKRRINAFISSSRTYMPKDTSLRDLVSMYESDFGVCRIILSRWAPSDAVLFLDSSRVEVLPLSGRSFHYKPLAATGDAESGMVLGEYTLEFRNENAHGVLRGLAA